VRSSVTRGCIRGIRQRQEKEQEETIAYESGTSYENRFASFSYLPCGSGDLEEMD